MADAGIHKGEIDGLIAEPQFGVPGLGFAYNFAEYIGIQPNFATALNENAATFIATAAAAIHAGYGDTFLCVNGAVTDGGIQFIEELGIMGYSLDDIFNGVMLPYNNHKHEPLRSGVTILAVNWYRGKLGVA